MNCRIATLLLVLGVTGCASGPGFDTATYPTVPGPGKAGRAYQQYIDAPVLWGGVIVSNTAFESGSRLEILAYDLGHRQAPETKRNSSGRYFLHSDHYLEPVDYAPGRLVTTSGSIVGAESDSDNPDSEIRFPVLKADQVHLWSGNNPNSIGTNISFGFIFSN